MSDSKYLIAKGNIEFNYSFTSKEFDTLKAKCPHFASLVSMDLTKDTRSDIEFIESISFVPNEIYDFDEVIAELSGFFVALEKYNPVYDNISFSVVEDGAPENTVTYTVQREVSILRQDYDSFSVLV